MAASIMSINLLPWRDIQKNQQKKQLCIHLFMMMLMIVFGLLTIHVILMHQLHKKLFEINLLNKKIESLSLFDQEKFKMKLLKRLRATIKIQNRANISNHDLVHLLIMLSNLLVPSMFLQWIEVNDKEIDLNGIAQNEPSIHQLIDLFEKQKIVKNIVLTDLTQDHHNRFNFYIRITR